MAPRPLRLDFPGPSGATLSARLDMPMELPKAYALFAHCFTCSKDILAARAIAKALTEAGLAVLRFDFTGLGNSGGDFASTNFSMNLGDLKAAADYLRQHYEAPSLLIGHSLGGAAVIAVAQDLPDVKAVATIAAPSDVTHVSAQFGDKLDEIQEKGEAEVSLGNRPFRIQKQFLDDMGKHDVTTAAATLKRALLVLHSPTDNTVGISNATDIFVAAKHPKSFASLDNADHLLSRVKDATYAANVIAAWAGRYLNIERDPSGPADHEDPEVIVKETGQGTFQNLIRTGPHHFLADEPTDVGGLGSGPSPYDLLCAALGACTTMTLRMYADRKKLPITNIQCKVSHEKSHNSDMDHLMTDGEMKPDVFTRRIRFDGDLAPEVHDRVFEIADKCPVHKTLETGAHVVTIRDDE